MSLASVISLILIRSGSDLREKNIHSPCHMCNIEGEKYSVWGKLENSQ